MSDDAPLTEDTAAQLEAALALNAQLKQMESMVLRDPVVVARRGSSSSVSSGRGRAASSSRGRNGGRTFTQQQEVEIARNNSHLLNRLARVKGETSTMSARTASAPPRREGHASINRRRKDQEIERENAVCARPRGARALARPPFGRPHARRPRADLRWASIPPRVPWQRIVARIQSQKSTFSKMKPPPSKAKPPPVPGRAAPLKQRA